MHQEGDGITIAKYGLLRGSHLLNKCWENTRGNWIKALKEAIFLPNKIDVCECAAHTNNKDCFNRKRQGIERHGRTVDKRNYVLYYLTITSKFVSLYREHAGLGDRAKCAQ